MGLLYIMNYVEITGPVRVDNKVGKFKSSVPKTEDMTIRLDIEDEEELHFVFTSTIHNILNEFAGEKFDSDILSKTVDTMNSNKWNIVVGGVFARQLYDQACLVAENYDGKNVQPQSPISVLLKWANSSRFDAQETEGPARVAEILMMSIAIEDDTVESFFETKVEWSDVVRQYNVFLDESVDLMKSD